MILRSLIYLTLLCAGCVNTVIAPPQVHDPVTVYLVDHGRTTSLVLPKGNNAVRWAYGDWNWYALENNGPLDALAALTLPRQATLGRRELEGAHDLASVRAQIPIFVQHLYSIEVERQREQRLLADLEKTFIANSTVEVIARPSDLNFVRHPSIYWQLHNSNHQICQWLREMGCQIKGPEIFAVWQVKKPLVQE